MRLPIQAPEQRWQSFVLVVLVVLIELAWGAALVLLALRLL
jgi:hypothetical protein